MNKGRVYTNVYLYAHTSLSCIPVCYDLYPNYYHSDALKCTAMKILI